MKRLPNMPVVHVMGSQALHVPKRDKSTAAKQAGAQEPIFVISGGAALSSSSTSSRSRSKN